MDIEELNANRLLQAREAARSSGAGGIGTLGEKTLHAVLKHYYEPDTTCHEIPIGRYVADIAGKDGLIEIQTRSFDRLRDKLEVFLDCGPVTVVYPVPALKWLIWVNVDTGELRPRRKSPKRYGPCQLLPELYRLRHLLDHPNLSFCVVLLEVEETRYLNGWSRDRKKGSTRLDRVPLSVLDEITISGPGDYAAFLSPALPAPFTSRDFQKTSGLSLSKAQTALNVLHRIGAVVRTGRTAQGYCYLPASPSERNVPS